MSRDIRGPPARWILWLLWVPTCSLSGARRRPTWGRHSVAWNRRVDQSGDYDAETERLIKLGATQLNEIEQGGIDGEPSPTRKVASSTSSQRWADLAYRLRASLRCGRPSEFSLKR